MTRRHSSNAHCLPQIGRAGRDGLASRCILLWSLGDWQKNDMIKVHKSTHIRRRTLLPAGYCVQEMSGLINMRLWVQDVGRMSAEASRVYQEGSERMQARIYPAAACAALSVVPSFAC